MIQPVLLDQLFDSKHVKTKKVKNLDFLLELLKNIDDKKVIKDLILHSNIDEKSKELLLNKFHISKSSKETKNFLNKFDQSLKYIRKNKESLKLDVNEVTTSNNIKILNSKNNKKEQLNIASLLNSLKDDKDWDVRCIVAEYSDKYHDKFKDDDSVAVRRAVAEYSDKYHDELKNDRRWTVRCAVAAYSDKYHSELKDDKDDDVRCVVARYSDKYHEQLKNDEDEDVRRVVAEYSDKYHDELKDDSSWTVRYAVAMYSDKYHDQLRTDEHIYVREAVENYNEKIKEQIVD